MAATLIGEDTGARQHQRTEKGEKTYTRRFKVRTSRAQDDGTIVKACPGIPAMYASYLIPTVAADPECLVIAIDARQDDNPHLWLVEVRYSNRYDFVRVRCDFGSDTLQEALEYDINGQAIDTSAGQPFDPPQEVERGRLVITMTRQESFGALPLPGTSLDLIDRLKTYLWKLNRDAWWGGRFPPRTCLMTDIRARDTGELAPLFEVQYVVKVADQYLAQGLRFAGLLPGTVTTGTGWDRKLLDQGTYSRNAGTNKLERILDPFGHPTNTPVKLDGAGGVLAPNGTPVYLNFEVYDDIDWAPLNLPGAPWV